LGIALGLFFDGINGIKRDFCMRFLHVNILGYSFGDFFLTGLTRLSGFLALLGFFYYSLYIDLFNNNSFRVYFEVKFRIKFG